MKKLLLILLFIFFLRIPSFIEPYWYGDEGIYLAIGQAVQREAILYRDIWDNKTPLLYFIYAISPTLVWAKLTATVFVLGTVFVTFKISKNYLVALIIGVLLSLPIFEGTIANAELYFTLPIAIGAYFLTKDKINPLIIGFLFATAFLLKVPAVFDFLGLFLAYIIIHRKIRPLIAAGIVFVILMIPIIGYFYFHNGLGDFITASFAQNASYVTVDTGPFSKLSNPLFVNAGILLFTIATAIFLFFKNKISKELLFFSFWLGFSVYGALLSNRPYPHYLLQIIPPIILLIWYLIANFKKYFWVFAPLIMVFLGLTNLFGKQLYFVQGLFSNNQVPYYSNFFDYISERKTWEQYANYFDPRTVTNYEIGNYIKGNSTANDSIFVWGDNAFIYVLSQRKPTTKFIQAHHLTTIPKGNYDLVANQVSDKKPKFIVIIRPVNFAFQKLETIVKNNYTLTRIFGSNFVYKLN